LKDQQQHRLVMGSGSVRNDFTDEARCASLPAHSPVCESTAYPDFSGCEKTITICAQESEHLGAKILVMATLAGGGFGVLPIELRLQVYRYPVTDNLEDGRPTDVKGIYLSCRVVLEEMEAECIKDTRHLLNAAYMWEKAGYCEAPIKFTLSYGSTS
jgi:hypothetical protein